ncbi:PEP/pyruvate-binding domain-containing protein [Candidatus Micrarchaeota archaeon]|nr:PEP/pyruvate-binding domain-containing protein [Candidatus Micrarchaeota archaeon]
MALFALPFKNLSKSSVPIAGGKGAQLGEMFNSGIPVPPGFVVLVDSFEAFLEENNLSGEIGNILKSVNAHKIKTVDAASSKIRSLISNGKISKEIEFEITKQFKKLDAKLVAVRSSATAEDAASASWAGELESYMNIQFPELLETVKKCWSSLFTPRAIFYRIEKKLHNQKVSVAVVVQKMVQSEVAGVVFSAHPVTKDKNQMVIEAAFGLGEVVVGGMVTPDNYIVDKTDFSIVDISVNEQEKMITRIISSKKIETKEIPVPANKRTSQKLDGKTIIDLAKICANIENHYKKPQDIEYAIELGKIYIVQSRPITTM